MQPTAPVEFARGVTKRYGAVAAVDAVDSSSSRGTLVTLLGPSGCGKTTTLRMIAGLETADRRPHPDRRPRRHQLPAAERDVSMVFQCYALFPHMTVLENVAYGLRRLGHAARPDARAGAGEARDGRPGRLERAPADRAVRRPAAARRGRARARAGARGAAVRRAAVQPRRAAAPRDARGDPRAAAAPRPDRGLRDARPGGGDGGLRPHHRHGRRRASRRTARRASSTSSRPSGSSPASWARPTRSRQHRGDRGARCRCRARRAAAPGLPHRGMPPGPGRPGDPAGSGCCCGSAGGGRGRRPATRQPRDLYGVRIPSTCWRRRSARCSSSRRTGCGAAARAKAAGFALDPEGVVLVRP